MSNQATTVKAFYLSDTPDLSLKRDLKRLKHKVGVKQTATGNTLVHCGRGGLHACRNPVDCLSYASLNDHARLILVELSGDMEEDTDKHAARHRTPLKIWSKRDTKAIFKAMQDGEVFTSEMAKKEIARRNAGSEKRIAAIEKMIDKLHREIDRINDKICDVEDEVNSKISEFVDHDDTRGRLFAKKHGVKVTP